MSLYLMFGMVLLQVVFVFWLAYTRHMGVWFQVGINVVVTVQALLIITIGALTPRHWIVRITLSFAACVLTLSSFFLYAARCENAPHGGFLTDMGPIHERSSTLLGLLATCAFTFALLSLARCRPLGWRLQFRRYRDDSLNRRTTSLSVRSLILSIALFAITLHLLIEVGGPYRYVSFDIYFAEVLASAAIVAALLAAALCVTIWSCLGRRRWPGWLLLGVLVIALTASTLVGLRTNDEPIAVFICLTPVIVAVTLLTMRRFGFRLLSTRQRASSVPETLSSTENAQRTRSWLSGACDPMTVAVLICAAYYGYVTACGAMGFHRVVYGDSEATRQLKVDHCFLVVIVGAESRVPMMLQSFRVTNEAVEYLRPACRFLGIGTENLELLINGRACDDQALEGLATLHEWRELDLEGTRISDRVMPIIGRLRELRSLNLSSTGVTDAGIAHLAQLHGLEELDLFGTGIGDLTITHLAGLTELRFLSLSETSITDRGLSQLAQLSKLESLELASTQITDNSLAQIARLRVLKHLDLSETRITDAGMEYLRNLQLRFLCLEGTMVGDKGLRHIHGQPICALTNRGTAITLFGLNRLFETLPEDVTWDPWDLYRLRTPMPVEPQLNAEFSASGVLAGEHLTVSGQTNLPAGTGLKLWLSVDEPTDGTYRFLASDHLTVVNVLEDGVLKNTSPTTSLTSNVDDNGRFRFPPHEVAEALRLDTRYSSLLRIRIEMAPPRQQPDAVRSVIGQTGERLAGKHAFLQWTLSDSAAPYGMTVSHASLTLLLTGSLDIPTEIEESEPIEIPIRWDDYWTYRNTLGASF